MLKLKPIRVALRFSNLTKQAPVNVEHELARLIADEIEKSHLNVEMKQVEVRSEDYVEVDFEYSARIYVMDEVELQQFVAEVLAGSLQLPKGEQTCN